MSGWNAHGHAVLAGHSADRWLGSGELQDAENCGYDPSPAMLAEMGVDETAVPALDQFRAGRIRLGDGTELVRGGTLGCVWAVAPALPDVPIVNLTPHPVIFVRPETPDEVDDITPWLDPGRPALPPSGRIARLAECELDQPRSTIPGAMPAETEWDERVSFSADADLPPPADGVRYVVSLATALAVDRSRMDIRIPYEQVRVGGTVAACRRLVRPLFDGSPV